MPSSGMWHPVTLVRTGVTEKGITSVIRVTRIGKLVTTVAVTSNRNTLLCTHGVTSQKTAFVIINVVCVHSCWSETGLFGT
jgi:hypothetical protein